MSVMLFITIFTLFILFREKVTGIALQLADMVELYGRSEAVLPWFKDFSHIIEKDKVDEPDQYPDITTAFHKITFNNITFKYPDTEDYVLQNKSLVLNTNNNNIIGITGPSGNGKSTIMKIALKLYPLSEGEILIDDIDIQSINPYYIRQNITYINQNSRLFDKTIIDNIMYGCKNDDVCKTHFDHIMTYPRIVELFKELDIEKDTVGYSGEKISGGQRQIVNLISGLINPSKILVLDEPTNALDKDLKKELLSIIKYFKAHKQCIIIITHDQDVHSLFDEHIEI
jgi:ABC-type bacteriocin/lantibiotic exporter with double-glycine peptidase domain